MHYFNWIIFSFSDSIGLFLSNLIHCSISSIHIVRKVPALVYGLKLFQFYESVYDTLKVDCNAILNLILSQIQAHRNELYQLKRGNKGSFYYSSVLKKVSPYHIYWIFWIFLFTNLFLQFGSNFKCECSTIFRFCPGSRKFLSDIRNSVLGNINIKRFLLFSSEFLTKFNFFSKNFKRVWTKTRIGATYSGWIVRETSKCDRRAVFSGKLWRFLFLKKAPNKIVLFQAIFWRIDRETARKIVMTMWFLVGFESQRKITSHSVNSRSISLAAVVVAQATVGIEMHEFKTNLLVLDGGVRPRKESKLEQFLMKYEERRPAVV